MIPWGYLGGMIIFGANKNSLNDGRSTRANMPYLHDSSYAAYSRFTENRDYGLEVIKLFRN